MIQVPGARYHGQVPGAKRIGLALRALNLAEAEWRAKNFIQRHYNENASASPTRSSLLSGTRHPAPGTYLMNITIEYCSM
jgi:hypothetical protein